MSCRGSHHTGCPCREELLADALDSLQTMVSGLESMLAEYPQLRSLIYKDFGIGLPSAKSVLRRAKKI